MKGSVIEIRMKQRSDTEHWEISYMICKKLNSSCFWVKYHAAHI